ncbi:MAG: AMP-dependent synthetase and ligase [Frankiales bacterium]|nr:AMP-dependent synthetase and ligase [Frankiales bacterium]
MADVSYGQRLRDLAAEREGATAFVFVAEDGSERDVSWRELDDRSNQVARLLQDRGIRVGDKVAVQLKNSPEHFFSSFGCWKVGATLVPVRWDLPDWEFQRLIEVMRPALVLTEAERSLFDESLQLSAAALPDVVSPDAYGICSSGATGTPKIIMRDRESLWGSEVLVTTPLIESYKDLVRPQKMLVASPMYHINGFFGNLNLLDGDTVVLMQRFNAALAIDLIEKHRVTGLLAATTMLQRIAQEPGVTERDFSSMDWVQQGAASIPPWLVRFWCDLLGPDRVFLSYGSSEQVGFVACRADEWLEHPGTLGKGFGNTEIRVLDGEGHDLPPGEVGEIWMRMPLKSGRYLGDVPPIPRNAEGFGFIGDLGRLDEEGWLYLADRRVDMIITGGANVFPAEVEAALSEHPAILDVVVIGLQDETWGRRVHAVVQRDEAWRGPDGASLDDAAVIGFAKERLAAYKVPKTVEFVAAIPRTEATKVNRARLIEEREQTAPV